MLSEFPITSRGIAGLFCNVWKGTGLGLKVVAPFVSRSKGAAVADLLREVGRRQDVSGGEDYVSALATLSGVGSPDIDERRRLDDRKLGVGHWVKSLLSSKPQKTPLVDEDMSGPFSCWLSSTPNTLRDELGRDRCEVAPLARVRRRFQEAAFARPLVDGAGSGPSPNYSTS